MIRCGAGILYKKQKFIYIHYGPDVREFEFRGVSDMHCKILANIVFTK